MNFIKNFLKNILKILCFINIFTIIKMKANLVIVKIAKKTLKVKFNKLRFIKEIVFQ